MFVNKVGFYYFSLSLCVSEIIDDLKFKIILIKVI